ncbi:MAG: metal ABC transporter ATP-binding protein [Actinomycetota bacterium]
MGPIFELKNATVVLDGGRVLDNVNFVLRKGEFVALLGENGAGKTTLVRVLLGLTPLASGSQEIFSTSPRSFKQRWRIGYVPQRMGAFSAVTASVAEVVLSGRVARSGPWPGYRLADRKAAEMALAAVGLEDKAELPVGRLSGGQKQRVMIARALAAEPEVLILDEPTAGLDIDSQEGLAETLGSLKATGHPVLLVAHGLGPIESLVTRIVALEAGRVCYDGPAPGPEWLAHLHGHHHAEAESSAWAGVKAPEFAPPGEK